jgi:hypothetical protein
MVILRFLLALMALLTGVTSAQSAVSVPAVQSAVGGSALQKDTAVKLAATRESTVNFGGILPFYGQWAREVSTPIAKLLNPTFNAVFIGDRQRV